MKGLFFKDKAQARQRLLLLQHEGQTKAMPAKPSRPVVERSPKGPTPQPLPGDDDEDQGASIGAPPASMSMEGRLPQGAARVIQPGPQMNRMEARGLTEPDYPARISRIRGTVRPGYAITIDGVDFGNAPGQVKLATRPEHPDGMLTLNIIRWSDAHIDCDLPRDLAPLAGTSPLSAVIHVWPHEVPESDRLPLSTEPEPRYPYSGSEGPMHYFEIEPLFPRIRHLSETTIAEGGYVDIRGRDFTYPGYSDELREVRVTSGGTEIPVSIVTWGEERVRVRIPNGEIADFAGAGGPDTLDCQVTLVNELGNASSSRSLTIARFDDVDLSVASVEMTWGSWRSHDPTECRLVPEIRNGGTETMWQTILVRFRNHRGDTWDVRVEPSAGGLAPGETARGPETVVNFDRDHRIWTEIVTDNVNPANDECMLAFDGGGRQYCD
jgi:hypothetical protein